MDVTPYLELKPAPRAVFDALAERRTRVRFMVPDGEDWRAVTWGAFASEIRELALFLSGCGLRPGDRAAVLAPNRVEWLSAALAIQAAGGVMVPVYPSLTPQQAGYVLRHSDARFVFVDTEPLAAAVAAVAGSCPGLERAVLMDDGLAAPEGAGVPWTGWSRARADGAARHREDPAALPALLAALDLDAPGLMLYTSGTSGDPKGVPLTHRNVGVNGRDWLACNGPLVEEGDVDALWLPMSHIFGFGEACLGNTLGWTSYLCSPLDVVARLPEVRPDVFMSVPAVWEKLALVAAQAPDPPARLAELTGGRLRFCLSGGAGLKLEVKEQYHRCGLLIIEGYGLTEASPTLTLNRPDAFRFDTVGRPLPSVELRLAEDGEILARGESVFSGYHKDPEATAEALSDDGWLKTGDVGRFTEDGFLQIVDRKKDILVTAGGKNVAPANVELRFRDDPMVAQAVVYGDGRRYLVAGVWPDPAAVQARCEAEGVSAGERPGRLRCWLQESVDRVNAGLARFETIKRFALLEEPLTVANGLLTPTLKVKRRRVYEAFAEAFEGLYD